MSEKTKEEVEFSALPLHMRQALELSDNFQSEKYPKCRCFYLVDGRVVFGVNLLETGDSFLVGAPSRLVKKDANSPIAVSPLYDSGVVRMIKSSVALLTTVPYKYRALYLEYLQATGGKMLPEYIDDIRLEGIAEVINTLDELDTKKPNRYKDFKYTGDMHTSSIESVMVH